MCVCFLFFVVVCLLCFVMVVFLFVCSCLFVVCLFVCLFVLLCVALLCVALLLFSCLFETLSSARVRLKGHQQEIIHLRRSLNGKLQLLLKE